MFTNDEVGYDDYDDVDDDLYALIMHLCHLLVLHIGVVGCGEGVMYLTSTGRPADICLQLGKLQARPAILVAGKGSWGMFLFLLFLFTSFLFLFVPCPSLLSPLLSLLFLYLGDDTKWPTRVDVLLNPNKINSTSYAIRIYYLLYISFNDHWLFQLYSPDMALPT